MDYQVDVRQRSLHYEGFLKLESFNLRHSLFQGGWSDYLDREVISRANAVAVLLFDPQQNKVVLIEEFRVGAINDPESAWVIELVAGYCEEGESLIDVMHRELQEEAGLQVHRHEVVIEFYSNPGICTDKVTVICAQVDASKAGGIHGVPSEGEDIRVVVYPFEEVGELLEKGILSSPSPIIALQWLQLNHQRLRDTWL
jgi:ADP-ribose pyrophosphatase